MSEMFDALRRAEEERRKQRNQRTAKAAAEQTERPAALSAIEPDARPATDPAADPAAEGHAIHEPSRLQSQADGFSDNLLRELGILQNSINTSLKDKKKKTLLFTSATPQEGTTTIGVSYARLLALQGEQRVLICEMNARKPIFRKLFAVENEAGVSDYFNGDKTLASIAHPTTAGNLDMIH
ncbi:MAG: hypothetical protein ABIA59_08115, partial [Candidatus Latescibacterota bacterium]